MPGVEITVGSVSGPTAPGRSPASTFFTVGQAERGPVDAPVKLASMSEFARVFGGSAAYASLYDSVRTFFEEGGSLAVVKRVVGPNAAAGALTTPLQDRAGTPAPTLGVAAVSPGAWSSRVSVKVLDGTGADNFRLQVLLDGKIAEDYSNLRSPAEAVATLNSSARASAYVRLTNLGSTAAAPQNNPKATDNPLTLSAGSDDRAAITTARYTEALELFDGGMGDGAVAIPGLGSLVHEALIAHANRYNRIALLSSERGTEIGTLLSQAAALDSPRAGLFAPWVVIPDGAGVGTKVVSPEAYIAAARARAHDQTGPWKAAAGEVSKARWVVEPDERLTPAEAATLDAGKVNAIITRAQAVRNYGWRSLAADQANWQFLSSADLVNRVVVLAERLLEPYVFAAIDAKGHLLSQIRGTLEGIVKPLADQGGLFPLVEVDVTGQTQTLDPGYRVEVDDANNPVASLAANTVYARLGLRPAPTAAMVFLDVAKASVTARL